MVQLFGTSKIKGILELSGINKQVKPGNMVPITDIEFCDNTVQVAINMGFVTYKKDNQTDTPFQSLKLRSIYNRPIRINALNGDISPGQQFTLTEDQISSADIRAALAKGLIEIVSSVRAKPIKEATVKIGNIFAEKENLSDILDGEYLETNEEASPPKIVEAKTRVVDTETPDPVAKKDVQDPKRKTVVWNPNRDPIAHTRTGMDAVTADNGDASSINATEEINFVDKKMEEERIKKHPVLKTIPQTNNDEIEFI